MKSISFWQYYSLYGIKAGLMDLSLKNPLTTSSCPEEKNRPTKTKTTPLTPILHTTFIPPIIQDKCK